jgi:hypothetical protein
MLSKSAGIAGLTLFAGLLPETVAQAKTFKSTFADTWATRRADRGTSIDWDLAAGGDHLEHIISP